jgi:hypothetical protein
VWQSLITNNLDTPGATANWRNLSADVVPVYGADVGSVNAILVTSITLSALTVGTSYYIKVLHANTGACTANIGGAGVTAIRKTTSAGIVPLTGYEFTPGFVYQLVFDGTNLQLMGQVTPPLIAQVFKQTTQQLTGNQEAAVLWDVFTQITPPQPGSIPWPTTFSAYDPFNMFGSSNVFTAPCAGKWKFTVSINAFNTNGAAGTANLYVNNTAPTSGGTGTPTAKIAQVNQVGGNNHMSLTGEVTLILAAGDTVTTSLYNVNPTMATNLVINYSLTSPGGLTAIDCVGNYMRVEYQGN